MIKSSRKCLILLYFIFVVVLFILSTTKINKIINKPIILVNSTKNQKNLTKKDLSDIIEVIKKNKIDDCTIISISNYGYLNLTLNWIESLQKINFTRYVLFCLDLKLFDYLTEKGYGNHLVKVPSAWIDFEITPYFATWAKTDYNHITQAKVHIWYQLLELNINFLFSDPDVVWLDKNIILHIQTIFKYSLAEIAMAQDQEPSDFFYNTGLFYAKSTHFCKQLFLKLIQEIRKDSENAIDQVVLGNMLRANNYNDSRIVGKYMF